MMNGKKLNHIGVRVDDLTRHKLTELENITGISPAALARKSFDSIIKHWETNGSISFPLKIVPATNPTHKVAEEPAEKK